MVCYNKFGDYMKQKKKTYFLIGIVILIIITGILYFLSMQYFTNQDNNQKFSVAPLVKEVDTSEEKIIGIPFQIKCNGKNSVKINLTGGVITSNQNQLAKYDGAFQAVCNTTVYWSSESDESLENVSLSFSRDEEEKEFFYQLQKEDQTWKIKEKKEN